MLATILTQEFEIKKNLSKMPVLLFLFDWDLYHIKDVLRWNRLRLSGQVYQQEEAPWAKKIMSFNEDQPPSQGRPKLR